MSTHPTDPEIDLLVSAFLGNCGPQATRVYDYTRAVLALWGSPPPKGEPVYAFRRKGLDDFCTCTEKRYAELSTKPNLFETRIFYTAPQPLPAYKDSTPEMHVGDSAFESWYSTYNPAHKSDKQRARDAYAAGMGDPLATAAPATAAGPSEFPHEQMDAVALARYKVVPSHESMLHRHAVVAGDGSRQLYIGREVECQNMARKFAGAVLDGAFAFHSMLAAAPTTRPAPAAVAGPVVDRATVIEWLDANDIEVTDRQMDGLFHSAALTAQEAPVARQTPQSEDLSGCGAQLLEENGRKVLSYWPYCSGCRKPFEFEKDEPFASCGCPGSTEWGDPRPASWVRPPSRLGAQAQEVSHG